MAKKIQLRLATLRAAETLGDLWPPNSGPERCHELIGDRSGTFSVDVKQPYRLLFKLIEDPALVPAINEQQRWQRTTKIEIQGIENTHG